MKIEMKPLAEVTSRAIEVLCREIGAADTIRFINQFTVGFGDYTAQRDTVFAQTSIEQIIADIKSAAPGPNS